MQVRLDDTVKLTQVERRILKNARVLLGQLQGQGCLQPNWSIRLEELDEIVAAEILHPIPEPD